MSLFGINELGLPADDLGTGGFYIDSLTVNLNGDDDDENETVDRDDSQAVPGEDDLVMLDLAPLLANIPPGEEGDVHLHYSFDAITSGDGENGITRLWLDAERTQSLTQETHDYGWVIPEGTTQLWIEGTGYGTDTLDFNWVPKPDDCTANYYDAVDLGVVYVEVPEPLGCHVNLNEVNEAPIAQDDQVYGKHSDWLYGDISLNDLDPNGDGFQVTVVDQPENGVIWQRAIELFDCNDGSFSYVPDAGFAGIDTFTYTISDGLETSSLATVELHVMNTPPSVADESYNLPSEESRLTGNVLENDFDADGDALRAELVQPPQHGELRLRDDGTFTYIADPNYGGTDSFVYQVVDGVVGAQRQASANITVQGPAPGGQNAPGQTVPLDLDTPSVLAEVNITSEHGVLVENTKDVLSDSGARYPTVEYRHELQGSGGDVIPITHTWDSKLNVDVRFESLNIFAGTQYRISAALSKGDSDPLAVVPTQPILFFVGQPKVANVDHVATDTLTSTNKLPREIAHWDASVSWILEIKNNNGQWESVFAATSKHEIFLIADVPDSAAGAPTYVRMAQSVRYVGNSVNWSTNPTWARVVVNTLRNHKFNLEESAGLINTDAPKAARFWKVPETWTLLNGSDCYSGAAWTELVTKMVGVPGTITSKRVSPESFENHTTPAQPERQRFPYTEIYREGAYSWNKALVMIDNGDNPNNFEGTVIYTTEPDENDQTKTFYIPVGWGENVYAREEDMLLLFKSVAWRVPENKHWGTRARNLAEKEYDANPATPERDDPVPVDIDNY